jgi:mannose-6-phosphate isomerase-like protein (cupin superfamily)
MGRQEMEPRTLNIDRALASFDQLWSPRILARVNDFELRVAKVKGEYVWHAHADTDELFILVDGALSIEMREEDGSDRVVHLHPNDVFVVPRGVEHRPVSENGASLLLLEPAGTLTTGDYQGEVPDHIDSTLGSELT